MVLTETINYHANHIGAIRTNKDRLKSEFNVDIIITRNRFGEYQAVDITGYTKDIKSVKKTLQEIVDIAEYEYNQYRDRKKGRQWANRKKYNSNDLQQSRLEPTFKKKYTNPFEVLNNLDDNVDNTSNKEYDNEYPKLPDVISSSNVSMSWADMMDDD